MHMTLRPDRTLIRAAARSTRYVLADIEAPQARRRPERLPVNVALVLDRSGSMGGEKIRLAREATAQALALLSSTDRFVLVVYDDQVDVIVESTHATPEAKRHALQRLASIDARGSTDLGGGWLAGCEQVASHASTASVGRCLLLTDGLANVGVTSAEQLAAATREMQGRGVVTSTFGVGRDFDERLLQAMAQASGGNFYFIETPAQIPDLLTSELGETLEVVARDAALVVRVPEGVEVRALGAYPTDVGGQVRRINVGSLVSSQSLQVVVSLTFDRGREAETVDVRFHLTDLDGALDTTEHVLTWTFAGHDENDRQLRDRIVDRAVAALHAAEARQQAVALNQAGRFDEARRVLERVASRIRAYAGDDPELNRLAADLLAEFEVYAVPMDAFAAKRAHYQAHAVMSNRMPDGKSRRHRP